MLAINELRVSQVVEPDLLLILEKFDDLAAAEFLRVWAHPPVKPGAALVWLVISLFYDYYENVLKAQELDFYLWIAATGRILNLRLEPVGDFCSLDLPPVGDAHKYPAARVGSSLSLALSVSP